MNLARPALAATVMSALLAACAPAKKADEETPKPSALISTAVARGGALDETVTAYGAAEFAAGAEHTLASPVDGVVAAVLAAPGASVRAGQAVVSLTPGPAVQLDLRKTAQDADTAEKALARARRLRVDGLVGDAEVETARQAARTASDARRALLQRIAGRVVQAPADGLVESVAVAPGDVVAAGAALAKLGSLGALRIRLGLDPAKASSMRPGDAVRLATLQGASLGEGAVSALDPRIDAQTRLAGVLVQSRARLLPGQSLRGEVVIRRAAGGVVVPRAAVVYEGDVPGVFVVAAGVAHRRAVKLGAGTGPEAALSEGVRPGEVVAVDGVAALEDGMAVRVGGAAEGKTGAPAR